jgi:hypothetical protein
VKDGLESPAMPEKPDEGDGRWPADGAPALAAPAVPSPGWLVADGPVFVARAANQLFVAAIACLTAWRPLSSTPLPDPAPSPRRSWSAFSPAEPAAAEAAPVAARKPALGVFELFGLPISSAGNGTGAGLDPGAPGAPAAPEPEDEEAADEGAEDEGEEVEPSVTASSGSGSAPFWPTAALAADRDVPDADDADRDVPDRVRDEDMVPLSSMDSAVSASGSTSCPDGATITDGSVARPASSTPSSSVPNGAPFVPSAEIT